MFSCKRNDFTILILAFVILSWVKPAFCITGPTLLMDRANENTRDTVFGFGPVAKYKYIEGYDGFEGDMGLFGGRLWVGRMNDPLFGVSYNEGSIKNDGYKMNLKQTALTVEDSFNSDPRVKWRMTLGWGKYDYIQRWSGKSEKDSTFGYCEPQIVGVLPMTKNIVLELALGWTISNTKDFDLDGVAVNAELLFGKF